eukprot:TRINITY_DN17192_c0_g1_i1.p1 TRINITY_DN17192_c0_g1~~TRINITY_DN17192_c0_g1_i1.p1  ORF type:complete len:512 (+),score=94.88 TRINITY_DN17192_c0_g1_i1:2-1537(+)
MRKIFCALLLATYIISVSCSACTFTSSDGSFYDMTAMKNRPFGVTTSVDGVDRVLSAVLCGAGDGITPCNNGTAVCEHDTKDKRNPQSFGKSIAYQELALTPDQGLYVVYSDGDACAQYPSHQFHSHLLLECDPDMNKVDILTYSLGKCSRYIRAASKYGCPVQETFEQCQFSDSLGRRFDFSPMNKLDLKGDIGGESLFFKVCGETQNGGCEAGTSVCKKSQTNSVSYGQFSTLAFSSDLSTINADFSAGVCKENVNLTTKIILQCDQGTTATVGEVVQNGECAYQITVKSKYACPRIQPCVFGDLDFRSLQNKEYKTTTAKGDEIKFKICGEIDDSHNGVIATIKETGATLGFGKYPSQFFSRTDNKIIDVHYDHGEVCQEGTDPASTTIHISCDPDAEFQVDSSSISLGGCRASLTIGTKYACPELNDDGSEIFSSSAPSNTIPPSQFRGYPGLIIGGIILAVVLCYFIAGAVYNKIKGKKGIEIIPNSRIWCCCIKQKTVQYTPLPL